MTGTAFEKRLVISVSIATNTPIICISVAIKRTAGITKVMYITMSAETCTEMKNGLWCRIINATALYAGPLGKGPTGSYKKIKDKEEKKKHMFIKKSLQVH